MLDISISLSCNDFEACLAFDIGKHLEPHRKKKNSFSTAWYWRVNLFGYHKIVQ